MTRIGMMAALLVGCGASAQPAPVERALPARDRPLEAEITEVFRVGTLDGDAWEAFGHVRAVDFGPDGELYILDQQAALVHGVSATGAYLGPIGRRGEGPGEFRVPTGLLVAPDGRILVRDTGAGTWTVFGPDGGYLENLRLDGSLARPSTLKVATDGTLIGLPNELRLVRNGRLTRSYLVEGGQAPDHVERLPLVACDHRGGSPRVIDRLWLAPREVGENGRLLDVAFLPSPLFDVLPDGRAVVVDSVAWQVRLVGGHRGGTPERLTRPIEPRRVTD